MGTVTARERLLTRAGLREDDQCAACLTESDALALLAMTGPGVSVLALRALIYLYLVETPPESVLLRGFHTQRTKKGDVA